VAPFSKGVVAMGERDFHPLSANFLLPHWLKSHWENYAQGKAKAGVKADAADWRVARTVFVADDDKVAAAYGRHDANSPYRFYYRQIQTKLTRSKRHVVFKERADQPDAEITYEFVLDRLCIYGTVSRVVDQILALREQIGDFGELVYAGMDWVDERLARRSMQLMAEEVMPRVNSAARKDYSSAVAPGAAR
jgi:alkanesulfonate monooxygenase SsuD/methylene tetrahydromethanopterin reductase-like flavin-dependent oxidoreductase (luciferase family)